MNIFIAEIPPNMYFFLLTASLQPLSKLRMMRRSKGLKLVNYLQDMTLWYVRFALTGPYPQQEESVRGNPKSVSSSPILYADAIPSRNVVFKVSSFSNMKS